MVSEVISIPDNDIVLPPDISGGVNKYIKGIGKVSSEVKLILDTDKLVSTDDSDIH